MGLFLAEFRFILPPPIAAQALSNCPSRDNHCTTNRIRVNGRCRLACVARFRSALVFVLVLATQMPATCSRVEHAHSTTIPYRLEMMYALAGWLDWLCWWDDVFVLHCLLHNQMDTWGSWVFCERAAEDTCSAAAAAAAARALSAAARVAHFLGEHTNCFSLHFCNAITGRASIAIDLRFSHVIVHAPSIENTSHVAENI